MEEWTHDPGTSCPTVLLMLGPDPEPYRFVVPSAVELLDAASLHHWPALLPGSLVQEDRERVEDRLRDPGDPCDMRRLHLAVQPLGTYLYGFPFYVAARVLSMVRRRQIAFRIWKLMNVHGELRSAADWCAAGLAWAMNGHEKETDRNRAWAELTVPGTVPERDDLIPEWLLQ